MTTRNTTIALLFAVALLAVMALVAHAYDSDDAILDAVMDMIYDAEDCTNRHFF